MNSLSVIHKSLNSTPPQIISSDGTASILKGGARIIDGASGIGVSCLSYPNRDVQDAIATQASRVPYASTNYTTEPCSLLARHILQHEAGGLAKAIFFSSGSEAIEAAIKTTLQYWAEKGRPEKRYFISRWYSYHGNTIGALSISGHEERRALYRHWLSPFVTFVDPCYAYRAKPTTQTEEAYVEGLLGQLETRILEIGPENIAAFAAETIPGSTLGCVVPCKGYFAGVRSLCDKYEILLILDEVMCGMGRTGTLHAWQQEEGFRGPDLQSISKSLGGGFVPISGLLIHDRVTKAIQNGSGVLKHSQTFQNHALACASALKVQQVIASKRILDNVQQMETKEELPRSLGFARAVIKAAYDRGLQLHGKHSEAGGRYNVEHVMILPRFVVRAAEILDIVGRLQAAIEDAALRVDLAAVKGGQSR